MSLSFSFFGSGTDPLTGTTSCGDVPQVTCGTTSSPFKTISFGKGVNFTAGLPIVRTSPDHGTGFDIAGKGIADHTSFTNAIKLGLQVFKLRNNLD